MRGTEGIIVKTAVSAIKTINYAFQDKMNRDESYFSSGNKCIS